MRSFKNDVLYRQGRFVGKQRMEQAIDRRSPRGIGTQNVLWEEEHHKLRALYRLGVRVPRPVAHAGNAIRREFVGNEDGLALRLLGTARPSTCWGTRAGWGHRLQMVEWDKNPPGDADFAS